MLLASVRNEIPKFIDDLRKSNDEIIAFVVLKMIASINAKVIVVGKGASGKDTFVAKLMKQNPESFRKMLWNTTRPIRTGEIQGVDYDFSKPFENSSDVMYSSKFDVNGEVWHYWLTKSNWDSGNIMIGTPAFLDSLYDDLQTNNRANCGVLYIDESEWVRRSRLMLRADADLVERRLDGDHADFYEFADYDYTLKNGRFLLKGEYPF